MRDKITFTTYFEQWVSRQPWTDGTAPAMRLAVGCATFGVRRQ
jgi:hypothetical protein